MPILTPTLKQEILNKINRYESLATYYGRNAEKETIGTEAQIEQFRHFIYNAGRANAMQEALDIIERIVG